jgi:hypothetical protein
VDLREVLVVEALTVLAVQEHLDKVMLAALEFTTLIFGAVEAAALALLASLEF